MHLSKSVFLLTVSCALFSLAVCQDEEPSISIDPRPDQAIKVNDDALYTCAFKKETIIWTHMSGDEVSKNNKSRIYYQGGELHIKSVVLNDTGKFICMTADNAHNITAELKVYEMPSYFTEGMIIVGINCALILLFIACGVHSLMQNKKDKQRRKEETYRRGPKHEEVLQME